MKIAPYYQKLLEAGLQAAKSLEPITFAGMFDSGVDYLFNLIIPLLGAELDKDTLPVAVDLSGLTMKEEVESELSFVFSEAGAEIQANSDYVRFTHQVRQLATKKKVVLVLYLGQEGRTDPGLFLFLNRLRNLLGWRFSYMVFVTARLLFHPDYNRPLIDKVLKRNIKLVFTLSESDADVILSNYEERYKKKLSKKNRRLVLKYAAGNPGIIKALYLQASENLTWEKPDIADERLFFRLAGIVNDVSSQYQKVLGGKHKSRRDHFQEQLIRFGYLKIQGKTLVPFTPLLREFLVYREQQGSKPSVPRTTVDEKLLHLTRSQRSLLTYLESRPGQLVSKDDIAKVLWGDSWAERYSDWAIDQLLSTLRDKMTAIKHEGKIITKRGEGIIFLPSKI